MALAMKSVGTIMIADISKNDCKVLIYILYLELLSKSNDFMMFLLKWINTVSTISNVYIAIS